VGAGVFRKDESVVCREVAGETFLVPISGRLASLQQLFVLNPSAAFAWERLDGARSLDAIVQEAVEAFDVSAEQARADVLELAAELEAAGLIVRV
jgi:hypothetical protein